MFIRKSQVAAKKSKSAVSFLDSLVIVVILRHVDPRYRVESSMLRVCYFRVYDDRVCFLALLTDGATLLRMKCHFPFLFPY